jgi:hypothetical protein
VSQNPSNPGRPEVIEGRIEIGGHEYDERNWRSFWSLIEEARSVGEDDESIIEHLTEALARLPVEVIVSWDHTLTELQFEASRVPGMGELALEATGRPTDDGLLDFLGWLVIRGEATFDAALKDPRTLAGIADRSSQCERLNYVAVEAVARINSIA